MHLAACALSLARANAGNSNAARMAIMAMTTNSSISVKPSSLLTERGFNFIYGLTTPKNVFVPLMALVAEVFVPLAVIGLPTRVHVLLAAATLVVLRTW